MDPLIKALAQSVLGHHETAIEMLEGIPDHAQNFEICLVKA